MLENLKMALDSIKSNKMRSFLTMLGIIIGVSSVIIIVSLGQGAKNAMIGKFEQIGAATLQVSVDTSKATKSEYITLDDINQLKNKIEDVKYVAPQVGRMANATTQAKSKRARVSGTTADMASIDSIEFLYGRFFNDRDVDSARAVAIIDQTSAKLMFGYEDATGKTLKIGTGTSSKTVTIIGVTKSDDSFGMGGDSMPLDITVPITFYNSIFTDVDLNISNIYVVASSKDTLDSVGVSVKNVLEARHNNKDKSIYKVQNLLKQLDQFTSVLNMVTAFVGAVAGISLVVGGIGVMNIMLVSVTERTREIGIRKAIGATTGAIMGQFLTEAIIISGLGGCIGMFIGIGVGELVGKLAGLEPYLSPLVIAGSILFSASVGIFFGIYPAKKAAQLDPIEALRYE